MAYRFGTSHPTKNANRVTEIVVILARCCSTAHTQATMAGTRRRIRNRNIDRPKMREATNEAPAMKYNTHIWRWQMKEPKKKNNCASSRKKKQRDREKKVELTTAHNTPNDPKVIHII